MMTSRRAVLANRPWLERVAAARRAGNQTSISNHVDPGTYLLHGYGGRLQGSLGVAGSVQARPTERVWKALYGAGRKS